MKRSFEAFNILNLYAFLFTWRYGYAVPFIRGVSMKDSITIDTLGTHGTCVHHDNVIAHCFNQAAAVRGGQNHGP